MDSQLSTLSVWAKATAKDTPAMGAASEANSPRGAPNAANTTSNETVKPAVTKDVFQDEKVGLKQVHENKEIDNGCFIVRQGLSVLSP